MIYSLVTVAVLGFALETPEAAVEAGGDALQPWGGYPWYDAQTDDVSPIPLPKPKPPPRAFTGPNLNPIGIDWFQWLAWGAIIVLFVVVAWLLVRIFLSSEAVAGANDRVKTEQDDGAGAIDRVEALPFQIRRPQSDLLSEARRHYEAGNLDEAIVYYYSYQLVELDKHQSIRLDKGKTNRQYLRELSGRGDLRSLVEQTMVAFEDVFFGNRRLNRSRFDACWRQLGFFQQTLGEVAA